MLQTASSCSVNCYCSIPNREEIRKEEEAERRRDILTELKEWREEFRRVERRTVEREEWREAERRRDILTELKEWREEFRRVEERRTVEREEREAERRAVGGAESAAVREEDMERERRRVWWRRLMCVCRD